MTGLMESFYEIGVSKYEHKPNKFLFSYSSNSEINKFKELCTDVMDNKSINILYFDTVLTNLIKHSSHNPFEICYEIFDNNTKSIYNDILNRLDKNE